MDFREMVLVFCALCVFGGILANAGMIVLLLVTSGRKGRREAAAGQHAADAASVERAVQYAATLKDAG